MIYGTEKFGFVNAKTRPKEADGDEEGRNWVEFSFAVEKTIQLAFDFCQCKFFYNSIYGPVSVPFINHLL